MGGKTGDTVKPEQKIIHRKNLILLGAKAIEHAIQFLPADDNSRQTIEKRITAVLKDQYDANEIRRYRKQRVGRPWTYCPENRLLEASEELILLADFGGHISGSRLHAVLVPCWDALGIIDSAKQAAEMSWQNKMIEPLIEQAFEHHGELLEIPV